MTRRLRGRLVRSSRAGVRIALSLAVLAASGCGTGGDASTTPVTPSGPGPVASVVVSAAADSLVEGSTLALSVTVRDASSREISGSTVSYASSNPAIASVDGAGLVLGVAPGNATLSATVSGRSGTLSLRVSGRAVQSVQIAAPVSTQIATGSTLQLIAAAVDANGKPVPYAPITWTSSAPAIATVSSAGLVTSLGPAGRFVVSANAGVIASAPLTLDVIPGAVAAVRVIAGSAQRGRVGAELPFPIDVRVTDAVGNGIPSVALVWSSTDSGAVIRPDSPTTDATGTARARWTLGIRAQPQTLRIVVGTTSTSLTATADADRAARIRASVDSLVLDTWGDTARVTGQVADRFGNPLPATSIVWSIADTSIARLSSAGAIQTLRAGVTTLLARSDTATLSTRLRVSLQRNMACRVPGAVQTPSVARGTAPTFVRSFGAFQQTFAPRFQLTDIARGDFDSDGDDDLLVMSSAFPPFPRTGETRYWRNDNGVFVEATTTALQGLPIVTDHTRQVEVADFNGDGIPDVFAGQHGYDSANDGAPNLLFLSQRAGLFREMGATNLSPYDTKTYTHSTASGDIDCDGDIDLFAGNAGGFFASFHRLFLNQGRGTFVADATRYPADIKPPMPQISASVMCDLDRDGDVDLYLGGNETSPDTFLLNDGFGRFRRPPRLVSPPLPFTEPRRTVVDASCADINRDGFMDLVLSSNDYYGDGAVEVWLGRGDWTFTDGSPLYAPRRFPIEWLWRATPADFDGDGWLDIYVRGDRGGDKLFMNRGSSAALIVQPPEGYLFMIDANRDGRMDLYWPGAFNHTASQEYKGHLYFSR